MNAAPIHRFDEGPPRAGGGAPGRAGRRRAVLAFVGLLMPLVACDPDPAEAPHRGPRAEDRRPGAVATVLAEDFELRVGEEARVDGTELTIRFDAVQEDSRCPVGVTCVWEGNARIVVTAREDDGPALDHEINTALEPRWAASPPFRIDLLDLSPWPEEGVLTPEEEYVARLRVTRR